MKAKSLPIALGKFNKLLSFILLFLLLAGFSNTLMSQTVSIFTDKDDYSPGTYVIITGSGWQNDSLVQLTLTHLDPFPDPLHTHESWNVTPNLDGYIYYEWYVDAQELNTSFQLDALGLTTGLNATTFFTDANLQNFAIPAQSGTLIYGTSSVATYIFTVSTNSTSGNANVVMSVTGLPVDISSYIFTPQSFTLAPSSSQSVKLEVISKDITNAVSANFSVTATGGGGGGFKTANGNFLINKANQAISIVTSSPANAVYNTGFTVAATASSGLPVAYTSTTPLINTGATYTMNSGTGIGVVRYNQAGNANYNAAPEVTANVAAVKAKATISLSNLSQIYDGTAKSATATTSPAGLTVVSFTYDGSSTAPTNAGSYAVVASLANANYQATNATGSLIIDKAIPTFTNLTASQSITYGTSTIRLAGTINGITPPSGTITLTINGISQNTTRGTGSNSNNFSVDFNTASLGVAASPYTITYTYPGDINFKTISDATKTLTVTQANATISLSSLSQTYDGSPKAVTTSTVPSGLSVVTVTYDGLSSVPTNAGSYAVVASLTNDNYSAKNASGTLVIANASPSFTNLTASQSITYGTPTITLTGKIAAGALIPGGSVSVAVDGTSGTGTIAGDGTFSILLNTASVPVAAPYIITYSYAASANLNGATNSSTTLTVNKATPVFSNLTTSQTITYGTPTVTLTGKINAGTLIPTGFVTIAFDGTNQTGAIAGDGSFSLVVNTASVAASVTPYVITYSYVTTTNFSAASNNSTSITVDKATATISLTNLTQTYDGTAKSVTATTNPIGLTGVSITYNGSATAPTNANSYAVIASLNNTNYQATDASGTLVIAKASPTFTNMTASQSIVYGTPSITLSGKISARSIVPTGSITVNVDGVTTTAAIKQVGSSIVLGTFTATITTSSINASAVPYTIIT